MRHLTMLCAVCLAMPASAQTFSGSGWLTAYASVFSSSDSQGGPYPGPVTAQASAGATLARTNATSYVSGLTASVNLDGSIWGAPTGRVDATADVVFLIQSQTPTAGRIIASISGDSGSIDIGSDGVAEIGKQGSGSFSVALGSSGLPIRIRVAGGANANGLFASFAASASLRFVADDNTLTPYGRTCNIVLQAALDRSGGMDRFLFRSTQAPTTPFAFLSFGITELNIPIWPSKCPLLADQLLGGSIVIVGGTNQIRIVIPRSPGLQFKAQTLVAETPPPNPVWRTSNGLRVHLN